MLPHLTQRNPWFTFLVHFRHVDDLQRHGLGVFLRNYSSSYEEFRTRMCSLPPVVVGEIAFGKAAIWGEVVNVQRLPEAMMNPQAFSSVLEALQLSVRRGSRVIGLGALTSPATGGGLSLLRHVPRGVTLTTGNAYTAAVVRQNVVDVSKSLGLDQRARVAVVGCTGSVGVPASLLLAEAGFDLILIARSARRAQHHLKAISAQAVFAEELTAIREANIVLVLTSDPSAKLTPEHVQQGSVIIDCAQPKNIEKSAAEQFRQLNIAVVEGGVVRIPGYSIPTDVLGLEDHRDTFACLAETYLFAREGIREHSVGRPTPEFALRLERIAQRHGVTPKPLNNKASIQHIHNKGIQSFAAAPESAIGRMAVRAS